MTWTMNWKGSRLPLKLTKRFGALLLVGGSLGLVLWSVTVRLSLVTEAQSQMHFPFSLTRQLDELRSSWSQQEVDALQENWKQFQARNFQDYDELVWWISRLSKKGSDLGFQVAYKIGEEGSPVDGVPSVKPVRIEFSFQEPRREDAYGNFMRFMKDVTDTHVAITIDRIEMSGNGRGVHKFDLELLALMNQKP